MDDLLVSMLYDVLGVSVVEEDRLEVLGAVAGPAGASAIDLPDGGVWEVDHLDPAVPVRFEVDLHGADRSPLLIAAFGGDGALYLADQAVEHRRGYRSAPDGDPEDDAMARGHSYRRPERSRYRPVADRDPHDPDLMAGRMVVLHDLAMDTASSSLARIAALAELLLRAYGVSGGELLMPARPGMIEVANGLATDVDDDHLEMLDTRTLNRLATMLTRLGRTGRGADSPLAELGVRARNMSVLRGPSMAAVASRHPGVVSLVDSPDPDAYGDVPTHDPGPEDGSADSGTDVPVLLPIGTTSLVDTGPVPTRSGDDYLDVRRFAPSRLRVSLTRCDGQRWVRVLRAHDRLPLAQAPLRLSDLVEVADLVVPSDVVDEDLVVEVVDPNDPAHSRGGPIESIRRAVQHGRVAARRMRVHGPAAARREWETCADLWRTVGDSERETAARSLAGGGPAPLIEPYVADEVTEALSAHP